MPPLIRRALATDLPAILRIVAAGAVTRPTSPGAVGDAELRAFAEIDADPHQLLLVAESDSRVVGTAQLTILRYLMRAGAPVGLVESVHVDPAMRSHGIGTALMQFVIDECRRRGCHRVQLTSDTRRIDAHRFYARLGFAASHVGFKRVL